MSEDWKKVLSNSSSITSRDLVKDGVLEEVVHDTMSTAPQHTVHNLPPFTNVSLRLLLSNPEGWKESEELLVLTDEDGMVQEQEVGLCWDLPSDLWSPCSSWSRPTRLHPGQQL